MVFEDIICLRKCLTWTLPTIKCAQISFVFIPSTNCTSNARFISDTIFGATILEKTGSMIGGYEREKEKL